MQTTLRKVGGSVMMTLPPAILEQLGLSAGSTVGVEIEGGRLVVERARKKYTAEELLADYDNVTPWTDEEREWLDAPRVGRELI